jgi:hypothetical protein
MRKVGVVIVLPVLTGLLVNWLTPVDVLGVSVDLVKWLARPLIVAYTLSGWLVLLLMVAPVGGGILLILIANHFKEESHLGYCQDMMFGVSWHWRYFGQAVNTDSIIARCPQCKGQLKVIDNSHYPMGDSITLKCYNCQFQRPFEIGLDSLLDRVVTEIERRVFTGEYRDAVERNLSEK